MKKHISTLLTIFFCISLLAQKTHALDPVEALTENSTKQTEKEPSPEKEKLNTQKETQPEDQKQEKPQQEGPLLRNYDMMKPYVEITASKNPLEQYSINIFYGIISGVLIGSGMSLYSYETNTTTNQATSAYSNDALLFGGIGAGVGILTGITISIIENNINRPLQLGFPIFENVWYGTLIGGATGALAGLIPYSMNGGDTGVGSGDVILQYTGYGLMGGFVLGVALNFIIPENDKVNFNLIATPELTQASIAVPF